LLLFLCSEVLLGVLSMSFSRTVLETSLEIDALVAADGELEGNTTLLSEWLGLFWYAIAHCF
jgi:hypothetical protein